MARVLFFYFKLGPAPLKMSTSFFSQYLSQIYVGVEDNKNNNN